MIRPRNSCFGKKIYTTFTAARHDAEAIRRKRDGHTEVYACRSCHKFHVGGHLRDPLLAKGERRGSKQAQSETSR